MERAKAMKCPDCNASNPKDAKFCGACGHALKAPASNEESGEFTWDNVFKWIGIGVVGLVVLGMLSNC